MKRQPSIQVPDLLEQVTVFFCQRMVDVGGLGPGGLDSERIPENERGLLLKDIPRIPNPRAPNHQLTISIHVLILHTKARSKKWQFKFPQNLFCTGGKNGLYAVVHGVNETFSIMKQLGFIYLFWGYLFLLRLVHSNIMLANRRLSLICTNFWGMKARYV